MYNQTIYKFVNHINWLENYNKSDKMKKNILIFSQNHSRRQKFNRNRTTFKKFNHDDNFPISKGQKTKNRYIIDLE